MRPCTLFLSSLSLAAAEYPEKGEDIYDPTADALVDIAVALDTAKGTNKNVLLMFGANWCVWCHRLHAAFAKDQQVAVGLARDYVLVMIDVNTRKGEQRNTAANEKYGDPIRFGLPVLVVLAADGRQLTTQETGALEEGSGHSPAKILAFLARWAPRR